MKKQRSNKKQTKRFTIKTGVKAGSQKGETSLYLIIKEPVVRNPKG